MEFSVSLPLPPKMLSPNVRAHYMAKAKATKVYREAWFVLFKSALPKGWIPGPVAIDVRYQSFRDCGGYHPKDVQNAQSALKAGIDGMVDAGVIHSDAKKQLAWNTFELLTTARETKRQAGVFVTVRKQ